MYIYILGFLGKDGLPLPSLENLQYKDADCKLLQVIAAICNYYVL